MILDYPDGTYPEQWDNLKGWLSACVPFSDFDNIDSAAGFHSAMEAIKVAHTTIDNATGMNLYGELYSIQLQANETPVQMITRARGIAAKLRTLNKPCTDYQIVSAIVGSLRKNSLWASEVKPFMRASGQNATLQELQNHLSTSDEAPLVAGAKMGRVMRTHMSEKNVTIVAS